MSESTEKKTRRARRIHHTGRSSQVLIYLGKQLRFFVNESDWKVLPMAAVIAALVGMVIRKRFFINMEGSLIGAFALTCTAIWNGCFNSIQSVCRERAIIKREHRSGMHISSYVSAHMIYQFMLCAAQTGLTMYVLTLMQVQIPAKGFMTPWMALDIGITMFLITYASDMMSLLISSVAHTTTGAMTIMPFVLIFQLVFSGGIIPLPAWSQQLSNYTISNYGIRAISAQSGYNELPMTTVWNAVSGMRNTEIGGTITLGQILDMLDSKAVEKYRDTVVLKSYTVGEAAEILNDAESSLHLREKEILHPVTVRTLVKTLLESDAFSRIRERKLWVTTDGIVTIDSLLRDLLASDKADEVLDTEIGATVTLGQVLDFLHADEIAEEKKDVTLNPEVTLGQIVDLLKNNKALQAQRDRTFTLKATVGDIFDVFGEENIRQLVQEKTAAASHKDEYERNVNNIVRNWLMLALFVLVFAFLATLSLELIDKDKR